MDDRSTDDTGALAARLSQEDLEYAFCAQDNAGAAAVRNLALRHAAGPLGPD